MRTLLPDPPPAPFDELLAQRERWGADRRDEVWEGVLHMNPPPTYEHQVIAQQLAELLGPLARQAELAAVVQEFALGDSNDYRVPDGGLHRPGASGVWHPTAALVIEIVSAGDETWNKLPFYAAHQVDELLIVDPYKRTADWLALTDRGYEPISQSQLIDLALPENRVTLSGGAESPLPWQRPRA
ncbi:MAG TPA: Uma2 family endonuclease [Steroidobacteraceae bacterium]|nr:Uma2 family endonuclease [Steroidobacteraceae bacterium]